MGNRLSKIYTRTGDDGNTGLGDGSRTAKDDARIEAIGSVDELNCAIGLLLCEQLPDDIRACLLNVQHCLFDIGGELSIPGHTGLYAGQNSRGQCRQHPLPESPVRPAVCHGASSEQTGRRGGCVVGTRPKIIIAPARRSYNNQISL
jgi:hypothetical protein